MKNEEQQYSKVQWFVMVIFIPVVFAIVLFSIILSMMGVNVFNEAKQVASKIPVISEYVKTEEQLLEEKEKTNLEEVVEKLNQREIEIARLEQSLTAKDDEIDALKNDIELLMKQLEEIENYHLEIEADYTEIAKLYEKMSVKNAARILSELPDEQAATHLSFIKTDVRAAILAQIPAEKAAKLITLISNN